MDTSIGRGVFVAFVFFFANFSGLSAQYAGSADILSGIVTDQSGAVVSGAVVRLTNPVSG